MGDLSAEGLAAALSNLEDHVFPQLECTAWERMIYYYLFRRTHVLGVQEAIVSIEHLAAVLPVSDFKARDAVRSLARKGCISILERSNKGHRIRVNLASEIGGILLEGNPEPEPSIEELDFYAGRRYAPALLRREGFACFYCGRELDEEHVVLDHVTPLAEGGDSTHRNVVAACHECNALKQGTDAAAFLRLLYRRGRIGGDELEDRLARLQMLRAGRLGIDVRTAIVGED